MGLHYIVRINKETFHKCKFDNKQIRKIMNFNNSADKDVLELEYYPYFLEKLSTKSFQIPEVRLAFHVIQNGQYLLSNNVERHIWPERMISTNIAGYPIDSDISYIDSDMVKFINKSLTKMDRKSFLSIIPEDIVEAHAFMTTGGKTHPRQLVDNILNKIVTFYRETEEKDLIPIVWED